MRPDSSRELGPTRVVIELPQLSAAEALAVIDFCERLSTQLWSDHGDALRAQILGDRRRCGCPHPVERPV